jgi:hypothetical protein
MLSSILASVEHQVNRSQDTAKLLLVSVAAGDVGISILQSLAED